MTTTLLFTVPLIYTTNQELIDHHLKNAQELVNAQTEQLRQVAGHHTAHATEATKQLVGDYTSKAQQLLRGRSTSPEVAQVQPQVQPEPAVRESDFPAAPQEELKVHEVPAPVVHSEPEPAVKYDEYEQEPLIAS